MTKQEKIKEAYGQYWENLKDEYQNKALQYSGWLEYSEITDNDGVLMNEIEMEKDNNFYRPKSLAGLEDNNGWISISNEGLPQTDESDGFWVMSDDYTFVLDCYFDSYDKEFKIIFQKAPVMNVTHYQPIVKPKPPIY